MTGKLDNALIHKAVNDLLRFEAAKTSKNSLVGGHAKPVIAQIQLKEAIKAPVLRPVRVKIPYSMFSSTKDEHTMCLFCRSEDKTKIMQYINDHPIGGLVNVMGLSEVKKHSASVKDKKKLLATYTHFVCDAAVLSLLYNVLGNVFGSRNNYPIPVEIKVMDKLGDNINKAVNASTYVHLKGQNLSVRFGHTHMKGTHIAKNIVDGLEFAVENKIKSHWKAIHSVHLKTSDSASIPIYAKNNDDLMKFVQDAGASTQTTVPTSTSSRASGQVVGRMKVKTDAIASTSKLTSASTSKLTSSTSSVVGKRKNSNVHEDSGRVKEKLASVSGTAKDAVVRRSLGKKQRT